jgi:methylmalonyl-CoA mutase
LENELRDLKETLPETTHQLLQEYHNRAAASRGGELAYNVRGKEIRQTTKSVSLSHSDIPKVALPATLEEDDGALYRWLRSENQPGFFPYTAGVFPLKRADEEPRRQFAGEGSAARTNARFHYLSEGDDAKRLSTAFDSVTLYGRDPAKRPDV